jgi:polyisoprenoid-binding protein YceI
MVRDRRISAVARVALSLGFVLLTGVGGARGESLYELNQRFGSIGFSVNHLGLFSSEGSFERFDCSLDLDVAKPERSRIDVKIDAGSLAMSDRSAVDKLLSHDFFDVKDYPSISFHSTGIEPVGSSHYVIRGMLGLRGVERPQAFDAVLIGRSTDPATGYQTADFDVTGKLKRSEFGMNSDRIFISDTVALIIHMRIGLRPEDRAS